MEDFVRGEAGAYHLGGPGMSRDQDHTHNLSIIIIIYIYIIHLSQNASNNGCDTKKAAQGLGPSTLWHLHTLRHAAPFRAPQLRCGHLSCSAAAAAFVQDLGLLAEMGFDMASWMPPYDHPWYPWCTGLVAIAVAQFTEDVPKASWLQDWRMTFYRLSHSCWEWYCLKGNWLVPPKVLAWLLHSWFVPANWHDIYEISWFQVLMDSLLNLLSSVGKPGKALTRNLACWMRYQLSGGCICISHFVIFHTAFDEIDILVAPIGS